MVTLIACIIAIIGAFNWFSVGAFGFDFVSYLFGGQAAVMSRIIYILVGVSGVWLLANIIRKKGKISKV